MEQHKPDPSRIVLPKLVMAIKSMNGYHTFHCPACERRNKVHEKRAINYVPADESEGIKAHWTGTGSLHFVCCQCHREVHVDPCPQGGLIVL